jgi:hypothetical protein
VNTEVLEKANARCYDSPTGQHVKRLSEIGCGAVIVVAASVMTNSQIRIRCF